MTPAPPESRIKGPNPRWYENNRSSRAYQRRVAVIKRYMGYAQVPR